MKQIIVIFILIAVVSCSGGKRSNPVPVPPAKATLISPAANLVCVTGAVISDSKSSITFRWNASANTDSYDLHITDLLTSVPLGTQTTTDTNYTTTLSRGIPYSWFIVSKSSGGMTSTSDSWKFYNSGSGITTYAPFPAEIISPVFGAVVTATTGAIKLIWTGSAIGSNITGYDIYFGTNPTPPLLKSAVQDMSLDNVSVVSGSIYYWKVITKDSQGDTSDSGLFQFSVN